MIYLDEEKYAEIPIIISVILYRHNYVDNKIIGALRNNCSLFQNDKIGDVLTVSAFDIITILKNKFQEEIEETAMYSMDKISNNINSAYQLYYLLRYYTNVKLVNIFISKEKTFTKIASTNSEKFISLNYKIEKGTIKYDKYLNTKQIKLLNGLLTEIGLVKTLKNVSSYVCYAVDYIYDLENLPEKSKEKYKEVLEYSQRILSDKFRKDNTVLILITDY